MTCTRDSVRFVPDDGNEVGFRDTDCAVVRHWARKYRATLKREWLSSQGYVRTPARESDVPPFPTGGPAYEPGDLLLLASSLVAGASNEAALIAQLVSAGDVREYETFYNALSLEGYPPSILGAVPPPT
jgi:hypothetical protein